MKVDKEELKALIREEITNALNESAADDYWKTVVGVPASIDERARLDMWDRHQRQELKKS